MGASARNCILYIENKTVKGKVDQIVEFPCVDVLDTYHKRWRVHLYICFQRHDAAANVVHTTLRSLSQPFILSDVNIGDGRALANIGIPEGSQTCSSGRNTSDV